MGPSLYEILPRAAPPKGGALEVGSKAWGLISMAAAGLPVPPAFVLPTPWGEAYSGGRADDAGVRDALASGIASLENAAGLGFGSPRRPLLVSVRSGGAVSMPGMLETVLDIGVNRETVEGLIRLTGNPRLAWDCYRRLVQGYAEVVEGLPTDPFDQLVAEALSNAAVETEQELDHVSLRRLTQALLDRFQELAGTPFPQDPREQLARATGAVFRSWDAPKAATYRRLHGIDDGAGTAVTVQTMVFGNAGGASGSGVGFTRNPATGDRELYMDFQFNAQGQDVVGGRQTADDHERLRRGLPTVWTQLESVGSGLEALFRDAQDFEVTLQSGRLYVLQARRAKRTPWAAVRIAVDLVEEGMISPEEALSSVADLDLGSVVRTKVRSPQEQPLARAQVASIGIATGAIALDSDAAERMAKAGTPSILVRPETVTADIGGMAHAVGILTRFGGRTSHAAVVARQLGKVCLVACPDLTIDFDRRVCRIGERTMNEGEVLSLDGNTGAIYPGRLEIVVDRPDRELAALDAWQHPAKA